MPLRRILVALLLVMIVTSVVASLTTHTTDSTPPALPSTPPAGELARTIDATLPRSRPVRAAVGDHVVLAVKAATPDQIQIEGYDLLEPVDPLTPARFDFIADQAGSFDVTLVSTGQVLGRLEVVVSP